MATDATNELQPATEPPLASLPEPPRFVPLSLRMGLWFGGVANQTGWILFGIGMIFYWMFVTFADFESVQFYGEVETAPGNVQAVEKTSVKVNEQRVFKVEYRFQVAGVDYDDTSYTTQDRLRRGSKVTIEFPAGNPEVSRIENASGAIMPVWTCFLLLIPAIGLGFMTYGLRQGRRAARLLANGSAATATLMRQETTSTKINNRPVIRFHYEFPASDGNVYAATASTHRAEVLANSQQTLLYNPVNPGEATLLAHLPYRPQVDELGQFKPARIRHLFWTTFIPTVTIVGHGTFALWRLIAGT